MTISEIITGLQQKKETIEKEKDSVLTSTSVDDVTEHMIKVDEFRNDITKVQNSLSDKIAEMESLKRNLATMKRELKIQLDEEEAYKFQLLYQRKHSNA